MIRLADYIFDYLVSKEVDHVFMVTGGGAMFLNDAIGRNPSVKYVCCHHEQACAMAAEGYARVTNKVGVVNVTTGPGTINALNGVFGAYTDSIPMLIVSGQNKRETILPTYNIPGLRQLGEQEADIIQMVKGITKYSVLVNEPESIRYHLERALHLATSGRPGPVWLDIPVDVSSVQIDPSTLKGYDSAEDTFEVERAELERVCGEVLDRFEKAQRPTIMVGSGVRLADALGEMDRVVRSLGVPLTTAWTAHDSVETDHPSFCGRPGSIGDRSGNFCVQNSDVLLVLGSRLNIRQVSYNWQNFAKNAFRIQIDADPAELAKPTVKCELTLRCDLKVFLAELERQIEVRGSHPYRHKGWLDWSRGILSKYPGVTEKMKTPGRMINPYVFFDHLMRQLGKDDIVVCGNGSACVMPFQVGRIVNGMRLFCNSGSASMGYDLPAAIGAAFGDPKKRIICLAGDGSIMFNLQELQTIVHHRLNIKILVINNLGYLSMRTTQMNFFKGNLVGEGPRSGVTFPDFVKVGEAFGMNSVRISDPAFQTQLREFLSLDGYGLADVVVDPEQLFEPKLAARQLPDGKIVSPSLEDMWPFLPKEELTSNFYSRVESEAP